MSVTTAVAGSFSLLAPLPTGTTVLEASAGTGKTYAIAGLTARAIAEGRADVHQLLVVTFSRAATAELRLRVRARIRDTGRALAAIAEGARPVGDEVEQALTHGVDAATIRRRAERLERAFERFDTATIMTTHEFCHGMLAALGVLAPQAPLSTLVEDLRPLADEVAADAYLRRYARAERRPPFGFADTNRDGDDPGARTIARDAVAFAAALGPEGAPGVAGERVAFALDVRGEVERRKLERRVYSFDDQLARLASALHDPVLGAAARDRLAARYPVVLVDEFQDTDPVQWDILRTAFGDRGTLVLIGDPKQAIYKFRGADVHAYAAAVADAGLRTTLGVNHRSDAAVVDAVGHLFSGVLLGEGIGVPPVVAHHERRVTAEPGTPWAAGIQLRTVEAEKAVSGWHAHDVIGADLVRVVGRLLGPRPPLRRPDGDGLAPGDLAVLVRSNRRGQQLAEALAASGIPATFSGTSSVFTSAAADDWLTLLRALDAPRRSHLQRAALTDFVGGTVPALAHADDAQRSQWSLQLHTWARALRAGGVPALMAAVESDTDFTARLLSRPDGERLVTDHHHLAELLHGVAGLDVVRAADLAGWLADARATAVDSSERTRRLETDAAAVQLMTVHRAKGLQWPVVLLPEASHVVGRAEDRGGSLLLPHADGRLRDVGGRRAPGRERRWEQHLIEEADEDLRVLYVGFTRAQSHAIAWWAHHWEVGGAPLHRLLHAAHDPEQPARPPRYLDPRGLPEGGTPRLVPWLSPDSAVAVCAAEPDAAPPAPLPRDPAPPLAVRRFTRAVDADWRRTSYSGLTAMAHEAAFGPESPLLADESGDEVAVAPDPKLTAPSPLAGLPAGAAFGTVVHGVYEATDAHADDWRARLGAAADAALRRWPIAGLDAATLAAALEPSFTSPLGPLAPSATLRSFAPADRLCELDFEFGLTNPAATLADVAAALRDHLDADDPLSAYPDRLDGPLLAPQRLHGFLTGSIDAVLRLRDEGTPRHLIVDYKTNRLGSAGAAPEPLTIGHYTAPALAEAMMASHYPLQALLYSVALHRFLRLRLAGYDPERHLGGVAYLFVRGMAGPATPVVAGHPLGVFSWRPSSALIADVSALLEGGAG